MKLFEGKRICITGTLVNYGRKELKEILENEGAKITGSVGPATDYLIVGEDPGSKLGKAEALDVIIVREKRLHKVLKMNQAFNRGLGILELARKIQNAVILTTPPKRFEGGVVPSPDPCKYWDTDGRNGITVERPPVHDPAKELGPITININTENLTERIAEALDLQAEEVIEKARKHPGPCMYCGMDLDKEAQEEEKKPIRKLDNKPVRIQRSRV